MLAYFLLPKHTQKTYLIVKAVEIEHIMVFFKRFSAEKCAIFWLIGQ